MSGDTETGGTGLRDSRDPWVRRMVEADGHADRAEVLLSAPVTVLLKYRWMFARCCRVTDFTIGLAYLTGLEAAVARPRIRGLLNDNGFARAQAELLVIAEPPEGARGSARRTLSPQGEAQDLAAPKNPAAHALSGQQEDTVHDWAEWQTDMKGE